MCCVSSQCEARSQFVKIKIGKPPFPLDIMNQNKAVSPLLPKPLHSGSFVAPALGHLLMAEHCLFISSFSLCIPACVLVGHGGPPSPPIPAQLRAPWDTPGAHSFAYPPSLISLESQWRISEATLLPFRNP